VAKKVFVGNLRLDETVDAAHEAKLLRNLDHAGIVCFYDSFIDAEFFCIVTEFCDVRIIEKTSMWERGHSLVCVASL